MGSPVYLASYFSKKKSLPLSPVSPHSRALCLGRQVAGRDPELSSHFLKPALDVQAEANQLAIVPSSILPDPGGSLRGSVSPRVPKWLLPKFPNGSSMSPSVPWPVQLIILESPRSCQVFHLLWSQESWCAPGPK